MSSVKSKETLGLRLIVAAVGVITRLVGRKRDNRGEMRRSQSKSNCERRLETREQVCRHLQPTSESPIAMIGSKLFTAKSNYQRFSVARDRAYNRAVLWLSVNLSSRNNGSAVW